MTWGERICTVVEIDVDTCIETWGVAPCMAAFGGASVRKCYNTFSTCTYKQAYNKSFRTIRFCEESYPIKNGNYIPALVSVGGREQEVNIAGYRPLVGALGQRASVSVVLRDFTDRDTLMDPYWQDRMSGAAQADGVGYDPMDRGSFWTKFKARNPNYAGRSLRVIHGVVSENGVFLPTITRSYIMTEMKGPGNSGRVTITAKDILDLADNKKAQAPVINQGRLLADMDDSVNSIVLSPVGIGDAEYPLSGFATIGSEIIGFTRSGDNLTITRGQKGTQAASHNANDTIQVAFDVFMERADSVIYRLLTQYGKIPLSYIDYPDWQAEFNRWGASMMLSATICKPTGVSTLIGEINQLGITIWWDETAQKIRIKLNRPPTEKPAVWSDMNNIISIQQEDNDDERATRIVFWHVQIDPTKELGKDNFLRGYVNVFVDGEASDFYDESRTHTIYSRWMNHGSDATAKIITGRLLNRYKTSPITYKVKIDAKDDPSLTDVISLNSHVATDVTGNATPMMTQVFYRKDDKTGHSVDVILQRFQFDFGYGVITENTRPVYTASTEEQKNIGTYLVGPSLVFSDGRAAYQFV